jgi:hypothetical protein
MLSPLRADHRLGGVLDLAAFSVFGVVEENDKEKAPADWRSPKNACAATS